MTKKSYKNGGKISQKMADNFQEKIVENTKKNDGKISTKFLLAILFETYKNEMVGKINKKWRENFKEKF